jgi:polar amino acid transport system substrate-binding protein
VQSGTVELDTLNSANSDLSRRHKALIQIFKFPQDATAVLGLQTGRFTAIMEDYPVAAYNATQRPSVFQIAGQQIATSPYAMAFRKSDIALRVRVNQALTAMRKDGTYLKILKKYGLQQAAL